MSVMVQHVTGDWPTLALLAELFKSRRYFFKIHRLIVSDYYTLFPQLKIVGTAS